MARVLLLHGFTGAPASWDAVCERLPDGIDVLRPALLGHGAADGPAAATFDGEVDRLAGLLRQRCPAGWLAVGYSLGGRVALRLLLRHPELCRGGVLVGASPGLRTAAEREARRRADARFVRLLETEGLEAFLGSWRALPLFASQATMPAAVLAAQEGVRRSHRAQGLASALRVLGLGEMPNCWDELAGLELPVHLLVGEHDEKFRRLAEEMAGILPRATLEVVAGAGHNLPLEQPERVASAVLSR